MHHFKDRFSRFTRLLASISVKISGSGAKFYRPDALPDANQQKYTVHTLGFTTTTTPERKEASLSFASALQHQCPNWK